MVAGHGVPRGTVFASVPVGLSLRVGHPTGPLRILHERSTTGIGGNQAVAVIGPYPAVPGKQGGGVMP